MKTPKRIEPLIEDGLVDEVLRPLMSGKEAAVYVVRCGNQLRCAKVYKEANKRSFRQAAEYQEGRKVRNSRQARAMAKGSKFGRKETEDAWQNAEVAALFRLANADFHGHPTSALQRAESLWNQPPQDEKSVVPCSQRQVRLMVPYLRLQSFQFP